MQMLLQDHLVQYWPMLACSIGILCRALHNEIPNCGPAPGSKPSSDGVCGLLSHCARHCLDGHRKP